MTPLGWTIMGISVLIGSVGGYFIYNKFPKLLDIAHIKENKKINEVINNPNLLAEKLNAHGKIYEEGENGMRAEMQFKVGVNNEGEEVLEVEKIESKLKPSKRKPKESRLKVPKKKGKKKRGKR